MFVRSAFSSRFARTLGMVAVAAGLSILMLVAMPRTAKAEGDPPTSTVTMPVDGSWYKSLSSIWGTATDGGGSGVAFVEVSIQRDSDNKYWDGSNWKVSQKCQG